MSGVGFFELVILFMIGLVVLGPKRLPQVASQLGSWLGQARRMARVMKRQLEEELDIGDEFKDLRNIGEELRDDLTTRPSAMHVPRDDDTYSPMHDEPESPTANAPAGDESQGDAESDDTGHGSTQADSAQADSTEIDEPAQEATREKSA